MGLYQAACRSKSSVVVKISSLLNLKAELIKAKAIYLSLTIFEVFFVFYFQIDYVKMAGKIQK